LDMLFGGDATRIVFGFCISDCGGTGSNANAAQAAAVMTEVGDSYNCNGGAFFWVAQQDFGGSWSSTVNRAMDKNRGCSGSPVSPVSVPAATDPPKQAPTRSPATTQSQVPTQKPVATVTKQCCPNSFSGYRAFDACTKFYQCLNGEVLIGATFSCNPPTLFDASIQNCNWASAVNCEVDMCDGAGETPAPASSPTHSPVTSPATDPPAVPTGVCGNEYLCNTDQDPNRNRWNVFQIRRDGTCRERCVILDKVEYLTSSLNYECGRCPT
jgi:hypothetical protein